MSVDRVCVTGGQLAELLGISPRWCRELVTRGVLVRTGRDAYPLRANVRAFVRYLEAEQGLGPDTPRRRRDRAEAERAELRAERERLALLPRDAALAIAVDVADRLQAKLLAVPAAWSRELLGIRSRREAVVRLRQLMVQLLEELGRVAEDLEPRAEDVER